MTRTRLVILFSVLTCFISCIDATIDKKTFKEYLFLINSNSLEYNPYAGTSVKTNYFIWNSIEYSGWLNFCILDLKEEGNISLDSIFINDDYNREIGFSRFSNTTSVNNGHYLSYRNNFDFDTRINVDFYDVSAIDTIFRSENFVGFVSKPTKFSLSDTNHKQLVIFDDEIRDNRVLNLFYKSNNFLYFIQIKSARPRAKETIDYSFIKYLRIVQSSNFRQ